MTSLYEATKQALAFTMRDFSTVRDFEAAKAVLQDTIRSALIEEEKAVAWLAERKEHWRKEKEKIQATDPELSAALGWPGGISDPVLDRTLLLQMVAALRLTSKQALEALEDARTFTGAWPTGVSAITALRAALAQQAEPTVTEDMKSAVRWAPSSAYWSQRLREFFGPDAREGIDALERRLAKAQQAEQDLSRCPQCNGPADNGFDRSFPPSPYLCTKCMAEPVEPVAWECRAGGLKPLTQRQYDAQTVAIKRHYTRIAPPQRTMVPLTEEEIFKIENDIPDDVISDRAWTICLTRAVEKAVWEKNHGQA